MQQKSRETITPESTWPHITDSSGKVITPAEYMLAIQPHEDLCERIKVIKQRFAKEFEHPYAVTISPRVMLVRFRQYEMKELYLRNKLRSVINALPSYRLDFQDFGSYPTHSIFINICTQEPLKAIIRQLKQAQSLMTINKENKPNFIAEPHILLAGKLLPWQYEKGWLQYSNTHFAASCMVGQLILLKRKLPGAGWQLLENFRMLHVAAETIQGDLFG